MKRIEKKAEQVLLQCTITLYVLLSIPVVISLMWLTFVSTEMAISWIGYVLILYIIDDA